MRHFIKVILIFAAMLLLTGVLHAQGTPPMAVAGGPYAGNEGSPVAFDGSGSTDAEGDTLRFRWDFDSDSTWDSDWSLSPTAEHTWPDNRATSATLEVMDSTGSDTDVAAVVIANVAPLVSIDSVHGPTSGFILPLQAVRFFASFEDPGYLDTHTALWRVGTDSAVVATLVVENVPPDATGRSEYEYTFSAPGSYTVSFTVTDDDGGEGAAVLNVLVLSPSDVLDYIDSVVQSLPSSAFKKPADQRKHAISNKLDATQSMLALGDAEGAASKLVHDLRAKWDGTVDGHAANDWILDPEAQELLCLAVDGLIAYLESNPDSTAGEQASGDDRTREVLVPTKYGLAQNYPNPFNPNTRIPFVLEAASQVRLEIYNVMGRRVRSLADGYFPMGLHVLAWDGKGESGGIVPAGLYFYRLSTGSHSETRKMLMLK